ncbi:hypothetical protein QBC38DRAFT_460590 [Podospora fimiseda]|uniref:Uncharacterized protein n=1 Tax=Podospora fimiseda TaxID=252190 RepID=A0AAN6YN13_9PEZI|nr:hypothetical protein QBC38DRAFT_460590 [Podospora fimiseda]
MSSPYDYNYEDGSSYLPADMRHYLSPYENPGHHSDAGSRSGSRHGSQTGSRSGSQPGSRSGSQPAARSGSRASSQASRTSSQGSRVRYIEDELSALQLGAQAEYTALERVRVLEQIRSDPYKLVSLKQDSRKYRVTIFAFYLGFKMLQSSAGLRALADVGEKVWGGWRKATKDETLLEGNPKQNPGLMRSWAKDFLAKIRENPPTIFISDRVDGEGLTNRLSWRGETDIYDAKIAVLYRLNAVLIDNALMLADSEIDKADEEFEKLMFLLAISAAHELVHVFLGYLVGYDDVLTPQAAQWPGQPLLSKGEAGRTWEGYLMGFQLLAFHDPQSRFGEYQAGELIGVRSASSSSGVQLNHNWIRDCLRFNFNFRNPIPAKTVPISKRAKTMQYIRGPPKHREDVLGKELKPFIKGVNTIRCQDISENLMAEIKEIGRNRKAIYVRPSNRGMYTA